MARFIIAFAVVFALIGCTKATPTAPEAQFVPTPYSYLAGFTFAQPVYDISEGALYYGVVPGHTAPEYVTMDTMKVNATTSLAGAPVQSLVFLPKSAPLSWVVTANFADSVAAVITYKWFVTEWAETTFTIRLPVVAQP
jgi:hypothetical protein